MASNSTRAGLVNPIILGGDSGAYSLARAFHEAYGIHSTVLTIRSTRNMRYSSILTNVIEPRLDEPDVMVQAVRRQAEAAAAPSIVLTCVDYFVRQLSEHAGQLRDVAAVPYVEPEMLDKVAIKQNFEALCREVGVPFPKTETRVGGQALGALDLTFPVIVKPGDNAAWHLTSYPGKLKIHRAKDREELEALLATIRAAGYQGPMMIQDMVVGSDNTERSMTTFSGMDGKVRWAVGGQIVVSEHTPGTLGNPASVITCPEPRIEQAARALVEHVGWTGFANFDFKIDVRTSQPYIFEINPRTARSNYYLLASGFNPAVYYTRQYITGEELPVEPAHRSVFYTILPHAVTRGYLIDPAQRELARASSGWVHPLKYWRHEHDPRRIAWVYYTLHQQRKKMARNYPVSQALAEPQLRP